MLRRFATRLICCPVPRPLLFVIFLVNLAACATPAGPTYTYNEVVILNQSWSAVTDVQIASTDSGRVFSCGNIAPRGICSNKFSAQTYRGKPIRISWQIDGGRRHERVLELAVPADFSTEVPMRGVLVISARGEISAHLQQPVPGPHL